MVGLQEEESIAPYIWKSACTGSCGNKGGPVSLKGGGTWEEASLGVSPDLMSSKERCHQEQEGRITSTAWNSLKGGFSGERD